MQKVSRVRFGELEHIAPIRFKPISKNELSDKNPEIVDRMKYRVTGRGMTIALPLECDEEILGLQRTC
ncbi:hypothetical protein [Ructibacterium gallinarum]|uniref:Uncharacterized protein n=1 Tax=Ructibacterium gallinarum TaxID=2779355 RepID=A0A9D5M5A9_9FIRM|nr:hypothetical protein [Ructibacterium gallinarum]MBE5040880.1 hypothetical protein [Ructibacterium gallinarum]